MFKKKLTSYRKRFFNVLNGLKTLCETKFMDNVIDTDDKKPEEENEKNKNKLL